MLERKCIEDVIFPLTACSKDLYLLYQNVSTSGFHNIPTLFIYMVNISSKMDSVLVALVYRDLNIA